MMAAIKQHSGLLLSQLLQDLAVVTAVQDCEINAVQTDSRKVAAGDLFIALPGVNKNGLSYLAMVVQAGASAVVYDRKDQAAFEQELVKYQSQLVLIACDDVQANAGTIIDRFYVSASAQMEVIGVTGTDGKTSVSRFIAQMLSKNTRCGLIGTVGNGIWGELSPTTHTTPDVLALHKNLFDLKNKKATHVVMEVSSHGIDQKRIAGVQFNTLMLTNVTRDHLDYHGSEAEYRRVKMALFRETPAEHVVLNLDDAAGAQLAAELAQKTEVWGYSLDSKAVAKVNLVKIISLTAEMDGFRAEVATPAGEVSLHIPLLGQFNVANVLAALCVLLIDGVKLADAAERIAELKPAPGRMEAYRGVGKAAVVVDFAHTPVALESALAAIHVHTNARVWVVFGCGGDRDKGKRPLMGRAAELNADEVILTNDNPRTENDAVIVSDILAGIEDTTKVRIIHDREEAIKFAIENASPDDVILVAGKGHEDYQITGDLRKEFSDSAVVKKMLRGASV